MTRGTMPDVKRTLLVILFIAVPVFAASFGGDEQALRKLDRELVIATYMRDVAWFRQHLAKDYVLITGSGAAKTKAQLIAELEKSDLKIEPYEPSDVSVRLYEDTAVVSGRILQKYTAGGERVTADLRYSDVWMKTPDGWINVSGQASPISIKREPAK
jgi:ketosteroid isomerase-like protein